MLLLHKRNKKPVKPAGEGGAETLVVKCFDEAFDFKVLQGLGEESGVVGRYLEHPDHDKEHVHAVLLRAGARLGANNHLVLLLYIIAANDKRIWSTAGQQIQASLHDRLDTFAMHLTALARLARRLGSGRVLQHVQN